MTLRPPEDEGESARSFTVTGYLIGPNFFSGTFAGDRDALENALEDSLSPGPGTADPSDTRSDLSSDMYSASNMSGASHLGQATADARRSLQGGAALAA